MNWASFIAGFVSALIVVLMAAVFCFKPDKGGAQWRRYDEDRD